MKRFSSHINQKWRNILSSTSSLVEEFQLLVSLFPIFILVSIFRSIFIILPYILVNFQSELSEFRWCFFNNSVLKGLESVKELNCTNSLWWLIDSYEKLVYLISILWCALNFRRLIFIYNKCKTLDTTLVWLLNRNDMIDD